MGEIHRIEKASADDLDDLNGLLRAYCDFYEVAPSDADLRALSQSLIDRPDEGLQLICRNHSGSAVGFATIFWSWSTLSAQRIGVMNDLYVVDEERGKGLADRLIESCVEACKSRGATQLVWQTALDNARAQTVYERVGGVSSKWLDYSLPVDAG